MRHDAQHGGADHVGRHAQIKQTGDGSRGIVGVQRGEDQVAGEGGLDRHLRRFQIANFAHHDYVRVLPHQGAHAVSKAQINAMLHLHLVEGRLDHFDRVFDGTYVYFGRGEMLEGGIKRCRFAGTGGAGDQNYTIGALRHLLPACAILCRKSQFRKIAYQHFRVENTHD